MNLKYRKLVVKIKPIHKLARLIMYDSGILFYHKLNRNYNFQESIMKLRKARNHDRCFIIGNGPSLSEADLNCLVNEDCFGANEIYKIFSKTAWRPKYYVIVDRYIKSSPDEIRRIECESIFLSDYYWRFNDVLREDAICLHQSYNWNEKKYKFSSNITRKIVSSPTVSYASMQIAVYLGYKEIYLLGFDHNYSFEFDKNGNVIQTNQKATHFFDDEIPEDIIADVLGMTKAYEAFKEYVIENGIVVKNATRGGKLEIFERVSLEQILCV